MTTKEFVQKALYGGWEPNLVVDKDIEFVISDNYANGSDELSTFKRFILLQDRDLFLDPKAWEAVGKVIDKEVYNKAIEQGIFISSERWPWKIAMHRMIDAMCEGKSIEQFLETL